MASEASSGATSHALLGLLSICAMSGYDIRQMIPQSIGHFWNESYGQIYPALKQMTDGGLVEKRTEVQDGRPDRHVYTLTEDGRERLREWLRVPPKTSVVRNELLLKLFFGAHVPAEVNRGHVAAFLEAREQGLATFERIAERLRNEQKDDPQLPFWLITLSRGRHDALAAIAWAKETLAVLDGMESGAEEHKLVEVGDGA